MMTSIVRLKRRREDDAIDGLMMSSKRAKHEDGNTPGCTLKLAGTVKSLSESLKIVKSALQMEKLEEEYPMKRKGSENLNTRGRAGKRARPADDIEVVSCIGARKLEDLFKVKRSKISAEESKFCLLDLEKTSGKSMEGDYVYDIFYVKKENLMMTPVDGADFFFYCEEVDCSVTADDGEKLERDLEMNYFEDDQDDENYWDKDYPDEFGVFYQKDEDDDDDDKSNDDDNDDGLVDIEPENDYGDYLYHFTKAVTESVSQSKQSSKKLNSAITMLDNLRVHDDDDDDD